MQHTGRRNKTLMGEEWVCRHCYRGYVTVDINTVGWSMAEQWALQNSADFDAHRCAGELAARAARKIEEALWRQEHAKKIRRRA